MKTTVALLLVAWMAAWSCHANPLFVLAGNTVPPAGGGTVLTTGEDCEGTGAPSGWSNAGNWDYTTSPIAGAQSWYRASAVQDYYTITDGDTWYAVVKFKVADGTPANTYTLFGFRTSAASALCLAQLRTNGTMAVFANGLASGETTDVVADNTTYWARLIWRDGGWCSIEFNTSGTFNETGTDYTQRIGGTTTDCTRFYLGNGTTSDVVWFDDIRLSATAIP